jgi:hypothetical protein
MPRYHIRVIPDNGKPSLYLARNYSDFHDGPFTDRFERRLTFAKPFGADRRIAIEVDRLPNQYYGDVAFVVVEEDDPRHCARCEKPIHNEPAPSGRPCWVDDEGGDVCGWGGGDEPHKPA